MRPLQLVIMVITVAAISFTLGLLIHAETSWKRYEAGITTGLELCRAAVR